MTENIQKQMCTFADERFAGPRVHALGRHRVTWLLPQKFLTSSKVHQAGRNCHFSWKSLHKARVIARGDFSHH